MIVSICAVPNPNKGDAMNVYVVSCTEQIDDRFFDSTVGISNSVESAKQLAFEAFEGFDFKWLESRYSDSQEILWEAPINENKSVTIERFKLFSNRNRLSCPTCCQPRAPEEED